MSTDPFICTADHPWSEGKEELGQSIQHPDAVEGEQDDDWFSGISYARFTCSNCGHRWKQELPQ